MQERLGNARTDLQNLTSSPSLLFILRAEDAKRATKSCSTGSVESVSTHDVEVALPLCGDLNIAFCSLGNDRR